MKYLNKPVYYLVDSDFDRKGNLINKNIPLNIPVCIMIQAVFCGYCTVAKPAFQDFAIKYHNKVFCATIQGDGNEKGEPELSNRIKQIDPHFKGFPSYVLYKNGKYVKSGDARSFVELERFVFK
jgi:hypothetical protein